ncbi:MAG: AAA family ATPase [Anaerolineae bacterium]|nr:AAA family ATPase [Anaerolineae bacterium]MBT7988813.1 AAA family ATPase [Anaerolineae bacterium]
MKRSLTSSDSLPASFFYEKKQGDLILVSGPSGSGKTTFCSKLVNLARSSDTSIGGILCLAVFEGGNKVGIDQYDIKSGKQQRLGLRSKWVNSYAVGCWHLSKNVISQGNQALAELSKEDVVIIDEIGPLEFEDGCGYQQALRLLDKGCYRLAFVAVRPSLLLVAQKRWPHAQTCVLGSVAQ